MQRPESLKDWALLLSCAFLFLLVAFALFDWFARPPQAGALQQGTDSLAAPARVVKPNRAPPRLEMALRSGLTAVVQNFEHLPNKVIANELLRLPVGAQITVSRRSDDGHLGGPCDVWAISHAGAQVLSLSDVVQAQDAAALSRYKVVFLFLGLSLIAYAVGARRRRTSAA